MFALAINIKPVKGATITVPDDYPTIQEAINAASAGDTIFVHVGIYSESIIVNKSLNLIGENPESTIIDGTAVKLGNVISIASDNVMIENFTLEGPEYFGNTIMTGGRTNITIQNNKIQGGYQTRGIYLDSSNSTVIGNNMTRGTPDLFISGASNCTLRNNIMDMNGYGFGVSGNLEQLASLSIDDSNCYTNGKRVYYWVNRHDSVIPDDAGYVGLVNCSGITVANLYLGHDFQGLFLAFTNSSKVIGNIIKNNTYAVVMDYSFNNVISSNEIDDIVWNIGLVMNNCSGNIISCNNISHVVTYGISLDDSSTNMIYHNNFEVNSPAEVVNSYDNSWDDGYPSGGNYWSSYTGTDLFSGLGQNQPGSDGLGDTPYIIDVNNTDCYPLMHPWSPLPVHNINTGLGYAKIQEAINADETLNGHTIFVEAGTYYENVVANKTLSFIGESRDTTIIDGNKGGSVVQVISNNVTISNFTIMNATTGISAYGSAYAYIENNWVRSCEEGIRFGPSFGNVIKGNIITSIVLHSDSGAGILFYGSSNNTITENTITLNEWVGVQLSDSSNNNSISGNNITNNKYGIQLDRSSNNSITGNNITTNNGYGIWLYDSSNYNTISGNNANNNYHGIFLYSSENNLISNNLVENNGYDGIFLNFADNNLISNNTCEYNGAQGIRSGIELWNSENNLISNNTASSNYDRGISLSHSDHNTIFYNICENNYYHGIHLDYSSNNTISHNSCENNAYGSGISLDSSSNNMVSGNNVTNNYYDGIYLGYSSSNSIVGNNIKNNKQGIYLRESSNNKFYHNNFMDNAHQVYFYPPSYANCWDDGYPSGGNYWSNYTGVDLNHGPNQNIAGRDGVGDTAHTIDANNTDRYPLMGPFRTFDAGTWNGVTYHIDIVSKSNITNLDFNPYASPYPTLSFDVEGANGTTGFCRITIPKDLMWCDNKDEWTITVGGTLTPATNITETTDYTYLYFTYTHSAKTVQIQSTNAVPELPSALATTLILVTILFAAILLAKKRKQKPKVDCPSGTSQPLQHACMPALRIHRAPSSGLRETGKKRSCSERILERLEIPHPGRFFHCFN